MTFRLARRDARRPASPGRTRSRPTVCVVGPSKRFLSGLTYYTFGLCNALNDVSDVSAIFLRQLLPTRLYPGHQRVGADLSTLRLSQSVARLDGVDWYWFPSLVRALYFLLKQRPDILVLQWWTGTVLHTYLALAAIARLMGTRVIIEFHEALDPGEDSIRWVSYYVNRLLPVLCRMADGYVVHSRYDMEFVSGRYKLQNKPVEIIPHATYDHYRRGGRLRYAPDSCCNLLYFGLIRPYKGVDALIRAFDAIPPEEIHRYWLTVVGETWEDCTEPSRLIEESRYRHRITFINRYVSDAEVDAVFGGADVVVLPYQRSSQSGTLHVAVNYGLPVIVTSVGGLVEAVDDYEGAIVVQPGDHQGLVTAITRAVELRGLRFKDAWSWRSVAERYVDFLARVAGLGRQAETRGLPTPAGVEHEELAAVR
jgi:glycosyltransferase involved in cell wall biosynthesis